ncbi:MAG: type II toxin-antitoxin system RelE/ParE family toxin [Akkermansiaceae bacterium]
MELIYHRLAVEDVREIARNHAEISEKVEELFWADLESALEMIRKYPGQHPDPNFPKMRRRNLKKFPFHVIFEEHVGFVQIMVVRHHRRKVSYGMRRK